MNDLHLRNLQKLWDTCLLVFHISCQGGIKPGFDFIQEILKKFDTINPDWLILGRGEIYKTTDRVLDNSKKSTIKESTNKSQVKSEPDSPYVSNVKVETDGKVIVKYLSSILIRHLMNIYHRRS